MTVIDLLPTGKQKGVTMHSILLPLEAWDHLSLFLLNINSKVVQEGVYGSEKNKERVITRTQRIK